MIMKLADEIKRLRIKKGFSKRKLAEYSKVSSAYIVQIEQGKIKNIGPDILRKLAPWLDTTYTNLAKLAGYFPEHIAEVPAKYGGITDVDGKPLSDYEKAAAEEAVRAVRKGVQAVERLERKNA